MQLNRLTLTQFRAFEQAEFEFQPRMNLLVGVNGVGKSTVLDALRILLSQILPKFTASKSPPDYFESDDVTVERSALTAQLEFSIALGDSLPLFQSSSSKTRFTYLAHKPREQYGASTVDDGAIYVPSRQVTRKQRMKRRRELAEGYISPERYELTPSEKTIPKSIKTAPRQPLAVYYSPHRSLYEMRELSKSRLSGGQAVAFADALSQERELNVLEFAERWLVWVVMSHETNVEPEMTRVLDDVVSRFLDGFSNLHASRELRRIQTEQYETQLLLEKNGMTLDVRQLSDGERGVLALALDLATRLAQANPSSHDPLREGNAIVLIDELDLHLHPRWQRDIVKKLTDTFPNCQFIVTTHSPQIVGEVPPANIILLESGVPPYRPNQSLGMDTNWILKRLMGTDEREEKTQKELKKIARLIENEKYEQATKAIDKLRERLGEFPELVRLQTRIDRIRLLAQ